MIKRIKVFVFGYKEYIPIEDIYIYENKKYTNKSFIHFLKSSGIWFNTYFKEIEVLK